MQIAFFAGTSWQDWVIRQAQRRRCGAAARFTHCAIVVGNHTIEATSTGVVQGTMAGRTAVMRTVHLADERAALRFAELQLHREYGWVDIAFVGLSLLTGCKIRLHPTDSTICSQLVADALEHGGWQGSRAPIATSPGDLYLELTA